jgi:hypothetical protein
MGVARADFPKQVPECGGCGWREDRVMVEGHGCVMAHRVVVVSLVMSLVMPWSRDPARSDHPSYG